MRPPLDYLSASELPRREGPRPAPAPCEAPPPVEMNVMLVSQVELVDRGHGVAAADDGVGLLVFSHGLGHGLRACLERHRISNTPMGPFQNTVAACRWPRRTARPSQGRCRGPSCRRGSRRPIRWRVLASSAKLIGAHDVHGKQQLHAALLGLLHHSRRRARPSLPL